MSSYYRPAYHPKSKTIRNALWADDYFGCHEYGVLFDGDERTYRPEEVEIPQDKIFIISEEEIKP